MKKCLVIGSMVAMLCMVVSVCYAGSTGGWGLGVASGTRAAAAGNNSDWWKPASSVSGTRAAAAGNNSDWWKLAFPDTLQEDTQ